MVNRANGRALNGFKLRLPKPDFFPHTIQYTLKMEKIVQKKVFIYKFNNYNVYNAIESSRFFFKFHPLMTNSTKSFIRNTSKFAIFLEYQNLAFFHFVQHYFFPLIFPKLYCTFSSNFRALCACTTKILVF